MKLRWVSKGLTRWHDPCVADLWSLGMGLKMKIRQSAALGVGLPAAIDRGRLSAEARALPGLLRSVFGAPWGRQPPTLGRSTIHIRKLMTGSAMVLATLTALGIGLPARASVLEIPAANGGVETLGENINNAVLYAPANLLVGNFISVTGTSIAPDELSTGTVSINPDPTVYALDTASGLSGYSEVDCELDYYFLIKGPSVVSVPLVFNAVVYTGSSGGGAVDESARLLIRAQNDLSVLAYFPVQNSLTDDIIADNISSGEVIIPSNEIIDVSMDVRATAQSFGGSVQSTAYVDPSFAIDPTFLLSNPGYQLQFSQGVGNPFPSTVPSCPPGR